jgi:phage-related protein
MSNTVNIEITGDASDASAAFRDVGTSAESMSSQVEEASGAYGAAAEGADLAEQRTMGFNDTLSGTADTAAGVGMIMKGNLYEGFTTAGGGVAALASGFSNFLIPMLEKTRLGVLAKAGADKVAAAGSKAWSIAQNLLNLSLLASPITWIIIGIAALVGVIVLIATKTTWFQTAWQVAWRAIKSGAETVWNWIKKLPEWIGDAFATITKFLTKPFDDAWAAIVKAADTTWKWLSGLPAKLGTMFSKVGGIIAAPFKAAFNGISNIWNSTVGKWSWTAPKFIPIIGGKTIHAPQMPTMHSGGIVPGMPGQPVPIMAMAGERVSAGGGSNRIVLGSDGTRLGDALVDMIAAAMRARGGDPAQLGITTAGVGA